MDKSTNQLCIPEKTAVQIEQMLNDHIRKMRDGTVEILDCSDYNSLENQDPNYQEILRLISENNIVVA